MGKLEFTGQTVTISLEEYNYLKGDDTIDEFKRTFRDAFRIEYSSEFYTPYTTPLKTPPLFTINKKALEECIRTIYKDNSMNIRWEE